MNCNKRNSKPFKYPTWVTIARDHRFFRVVSHTCTHCKFNIQTTRVFTKIVLQICVLVKTDEQYAGRFILPYLRVLRNIACDSGMNVKPVRTQDSVNLLVQRKQGSYPFCCHLVSLMPTLRTAVSCLRLRCWFYVGIRSVLSLRHAGLYVYRQSDTCYSPAGSNEDGTDLGSL